MHRFPARTKKKSTSGGGFIALVCLASLLVFPSLNESASAQSDETERPELNVFNHAGTPVGAVDKTGRVFNRLGRSIGSVDNTGIIYNISENAVGKVDSSGKVFNRLGTLVGSVEKDGNVFDNKGRKMGHVSFPVPWDLPVIGGAAWFLLFRVR